MTMKTSVNHERGATMIEVLVTLVIVTFGLLGMAGLQARLQASEMESYQRSQALMLLNDMANRIAVNRNNAEDYVTASAVGFDMICPDDDDTIAQRDAAEWCNALQGAAEKSSADDNIGAMIGGRGCVEQVGSDYMVTVVWQGLGPISAPPASVGCGANAFDQAGTPCVNDLCRRYVTTLVRIAALI
jgi:type IV pilus assembly protein PilV